MFFVETINKNDDASAPTGFPTNLASYQVTFFFIIFSEIIEMNKLTFLLMLRITSFCFVFRHGKYLFHLDPNISTDI